MPELRSLEFIDPKTGKYYAVLPAPGHIKVAYELGYIPISEKDFNRADEILYGQAD